MIPGRPRNPREFASSDHAQVWSWAAGCALRAMMSRAHLVDYLHAEGEANRLPLTHGVAAETAGALALAAMADIVRQHYPTYADAIQSAHDWLNGTSELPQL